MNRTNLGLGSRLSGTVRSGIALVATASLTGWSRVPGKCFARMLPLVKRQLLRNAFPALGECLPHASGNEFGKRRFIVVQMDFDAAACTDAAEVWLADLLLKADCDFVGHGFRS